MVSTHFRSAFQYIHLFLLSFSRGLIYEWYILVGAKLCPAKSYPTEWFLMISLSQLFQIRKVDILQYRFFAKWLIYTLFHKIMGSSLFHLWYDYQSKVLWFSSNDYISAKYSKK